MSPALIIAFVRSRRGRGLIAQGLVLAIVVGVVLGAIYQAQNSIARQGIASGFGFLNTTAGFDIIQHLIPYSEESTYFDALLVGVLNTLVVSVLGIVLASVVGLVIGIGSLSTNLLVSRLCAAYVETLRNIPLLLQIFFWYFAVLRAVPLPRESWSLGSVYLNNRGLILPWLEALPGAGWVGLAGLAGLGLWLTLAVLASRYRERTGRIVATGLLGLSLTLLAMLVTTLALDVPFAATVPVLEGLSFEGGLTILPELMALTLALSLYAGAFIAEIVRAGILGVPKGQSEASSALGLTRGQALRLVIVPQALRQIIPPLTSQYVNVAKGSSLAVAIAYPDLVSVFAGTTLNQTGQAIEVLSITMLIYLTISLTTSLAMNVYNAQIARTGLR